MAATFIPIESITLSTTTSVVTFTNIPNDYNDLVLLVSARSDQATASNVLQMVFNNDTSANYNLTGMYLNFGSTPAAFRVTAASAGNGRPVLAATATANAFTSSEFYIPKYTDTSIYKPWFSRTASPNRVSSSANFLTVDAGLWSNTAAITEIDLSLTNSASFVANSSFHLYGISNS